jgi:hypothetical protein
MEKAVFHKHLGEKEMNITLLGSQGGITNSARGPLDWHRRK